MPNNLYSIQLCACSDLTTVFPSGGGLGRLNRSSDEKIMRLLLRKAPEKIVRLLLIQVKFDPRLRDLVSSKILKTPEG